ncbi:MAG: tripartite tricarboxylate transporter substrate binding protein, partial [Comamonas sp.]
SYQPERIRLIARIVDDPAMLVANKESGKPMTLDAFIQAAKKEPNSLSIGHSGEGTTGHLGMLELAQKAGIKFSSIPYKGMGEAKTALMGGHIDYVMMTTGEGLEVSQPGSRLAGVALWASKRVANQVPTTAEQGYELKASSERGIGAPRGIPDDIARRLQESIEQSLRNSAFLEAAKADAPVLAFLPGEEWERHLQELRARLAPLVEQMRRSQ